jgi:hypothetical protein
MALRRKKPLISTQQALAARPVRLAEATLTPRADGGADLKIPMRPSRWAGLFFKMPTGATRTFELDALGLFVWNACDGKTSVQQIIRKFAARHQLNLREAQVPTVRFLQMLVKKGLIAMALERPGS